MGGILETTEDAILQDDPLEEGSEVKGSGVTGTEVTWDLDRPTEVVDGSTKTQEPLTSLSAGLCYLIHIPVFTLVLFCICD